MKSKLIGLTLVLTTLAAPAFASSHREAPHHGVNGGKVSQPGEDRPAQAPQAQVSVQLQEALRELLVAPPAQPAAPRR